MRNATGEAGRDSPTLDSVGRRGTVAYEFVREARRTVLSHSTCTSPWHFFPPSYPDDSGCAYVWLVNPSGGLVGGDEVSVEARLHAGSHVLVTSPSANRVYRTLAEAAVQDVRLSIGPGARLEWFPEVTIPFAGCRFRQSIRVELDPGATVVLWDAMASGRIARRERWAFAEFTNEIDIRTASGAPVIERFRVTPATAGRAAADWDYVGSLFVIGDAIGQDELERLADALALLLDQWPGAVLGGVSRPAGPGLAIKLVARSAADVNDAVTAISAVIRAALWQLPPAVLRRY